MTMLALLRWAALMEDAGERRGADSAHAQNSEAGGNQDR